MLSTQLRPSSGDAWIDGRSIRNPAEVRDRMAIVFQDPSLDLRLTAWENLSFYASLYRPMWSRAERESRIHRVLEQLGLSERARDLARTFSWGMRRRLEIARALLTDPRLLILDEPTTGLDLHTRANLWSSLNVQRQERNLTVVVATHDMFEAAQCDLIGVIANGRFIALDSPQNICAQTETTSLEAAFLKLTDAGTEKREEGPLLVRGRDSTLFRRGT